MKQRHLYALLFGIPGLFVAALVGLALFGAAAGLLWMFVLGDDAWPAEVGTLLPLGVLLVCLTLWSLFIGAGFAYGKGREAHPRVDRRHVVIAAGATLVPILLLLLHQLSVGNLGPASDSQVCSTYCRERGYSGSGMPPRDSGDRSCSCFDPDGREVLRIPLDTLTPER